MAAVGSSHVVSPIRPAVVAAIGSGVVAAVVATHHLEAVHHVFHVIVHVVHIVVVGLIIIGLTVVSLIVVFFLVFFLIVVFPSIRITHLAGP